MRGKTIVSAALLTAALAAMIIDATAEEGLRIRLGVCDWTIGKAGDPAALGLAGSLGIDGVQISLVPKGDTLALADQALQSAYIKAAVEAGVAIASLAIGDLNDVPLKSDPRAERWLGEGIDIASAMGVKVILVPFFGKGDLKGDPAGVDAVVAALKRLAPKAEAKSVVLALESWLSAGENMAILDRVGSPAVRVYYDVANSQEAGYPILDEILLLGNRIVEFHAKDTKDLYGKGSIDFPAVRKAMEDISYQGWLVMEGTKMPLGLEASVRYDADYLRKVLSESDKDAVGAAGEQGPQVTILSGKDVPTPKLVKTVAPKFPRAALAMGMRGTVVIEAVTDADGRVISTKVLKGVPAFNKAATDAVKKWVYDPPVVDGRRRPIVFTVTMSFSGSGRSEDSIIEQPKLLRQITPVYPEEAVRANIEGIVVLAITIGDHGLVMEVKVLESVPGLDQAAINAVKEWQYSGAWIGGEPVHYTTTVTIKFSLNGPKKRPETGPPSATAPSGRRNSAAASRARRTRRATARTSDRASGR
jgi:TonB family protein